MSTLGKTRHTMMNTDGSYEFRGFTIDADMLEGIRNYVDHGIEPGSFLSAVICNDLKAAVGAADYRNIRNIPAFVGYFYNEAPSACWGSNEKMIAWMAAKAVARVGLVRG